MHVFKYLDITSAVLLLENNEPGVCFQSQPQLIVMLIMMIYEDDNDGAGKQ